MQQRHRSSVTMHVVAYVKRHRWCGWALMIAECKHLNTKNFPLYAVRVNLYFL